MLSEFEIQGYRKFEDFKIKNLGQINFFVGSNNVGKTTVLESIYGWASGMNLSPFFWTGIMRNQIVQNATEYYIAETIYSAMHDRNNLPFSFRFSAIDDDEEIVFHHNITVGDTFRTFVKKVATTVSSMNNNESIKQNSINRFQQVNQFSMPVPIIQLAKWEIKNKTEDVKNYNLEWPNLFLENVEPKRLASFKDIGAHRNIEENRKIYSHLKRQHLLDKFIKEMQSVFPELQSIDILPYPDNSPTPISIQLKNGEYFPLDTFGDGFKRWYHIIGSLILYNDSIICIDEIDATLHPKAQYEICQKIIKYSQKYNVQLFITTHNLEFVDHLLTAWNNYKDIDKKEDIRIITMKEINNQVKIRNMSAEEALKAREDFQMELR